MASLNIPCHCQDATTTMTGAAQQVLPANTSRSFLMIQAPAATNNVTFSFTNANPTVGGPGCFTLLAGSGPLIFSPQVPDGPLYIFGAAGVAVVLAG